jgi:BASS family bile acid:Na+ symporter
LKPAYFRPLHENFGQLSLNTVVFCLCSPAPGYLLPRTLAVSRSQSVASSFEIGIHNATLAIVIAQTVIGSVEMSLPAGVYGVLMYFLAAGFGFPIRGRSGRDAAGIPTSESPSASS